METQPHNLTQTQQQAANELANGKLVGNSTTNNTGSNYLCRQSSTRWTPTTEQIRILKDLYYNSGVRSPSAEQIQKISARLRQYGKIEGKNVFYWFQNHKARERQKKRFTTCTSTPNTTTTNTNTNTSSNDHLMVSMQKHGGGICKADANFGPAGISCPSSAAAGIVSVGQVVGGFGYGHVRLGNHLRDCAISPCGNGGMCSGFPTHNFQWAAGGGGGGMQQPYPAGSCYSLMDSRNCFAVDQEHEQLPEEEEEEQHPAEIETLPLFPMHGEDTTSSSNFYTATMRPEPESEPGSYYANSCHWLNGSGSGTTRASLELSLNSYGSRWPNF